ncbi:ABC transporter permease [Aquibium microcysteis]|uniref:ABC transporter permease n=1 Tax=Aquibium microcysteis TaxID=675281 RepID=UPI00165CFF52|nr:ABC transporter permease [Aquibium microcysteis]
MSDAPLAADAGLDASAGAGKARRKLASVQLVPFLEVRQSVSERYRIAVYAASLAVAALASVALLAASGVAPADLAREIATVGFGSPRALGSVLAQTAPLAIGGLATAIAFRAGFWNIGLEGQMILGAIFAAFVAIHDVGPESLRIVLMALAACAGGMLWIAGPGFLKQRLGVNEVISTLLLNYVAFNLLLHLLYGPWKDPVSAFPHTQQFETVERLAPLGWQNLTLALPLAIAVVLVAWWALSVSRFGYLVDLMRANREMARAVGVPVAALSTVAILASGAVGGLAGFAISAGIEFRTTQNFFVGYLFSGVLIAFIARNHPLGVLVVSFAMAVLLLLGQSLQVFFGIPAALVQLVQAIFIVCVAASEFFLTYRMHWRSAS